MASTASSESEKSSVVNLATASSKGPARAGPATAISTRASRRRRSGAISLASTGKPRQEVKGRRRHRRLPCCYPIEVIRRRSCTRAEALVGLDVVVAALLADPVADQVLGTLQLLRPGIAGHQVLGLR